jgi:hypothetical protein
MLISSGSSGTGTVRTSTEGVSATASIGVSTREITPTATTPGRQLRQ